MDYIHFENAHWHLAIFGWIFQIMYSFIIGAFLTPPQQEQKKYKLLFLFNQAFIFAMVIMILINGYSVISIGFDIGFLVPVLFFIRSFLKDLKISSNAPAAFSEGLIKAALFFLALSFLGVFSMIPIELFYNAKRSILYYLSSQFFLHFEYNGWFTFGLFALFFRLCENNGVLFNTQKFVRFKWLMVFSAFLTYFLSIYWGYPGHYPFLFIAVTGGLLQLVSVFIIYHDFKNVFLEIKSKLNKYTKFLFLLSFCSFLVKLVLQVIIIFPRIAGLALSIRNYTIAYLHLMFLGVASTFFIGWAIEQKYILTARKKIDFPVITFAIGIVLIELLLVFQGTLLWMDFGFIPFYYESLFLITLLLPLSLFFIFIRNFKIFYKTLLFKAG